MSTRTHRTGALLAGVLTVMALGLSACDGGDPDSSTGTGTGTGTGSPSGTATSTSVDDLVQSLLVQGERLPAVASAQATVTRVYSSSYTADLTAEILEVRADADTTLLHWRLKSTAGDTVSAGGNWAAAPKGTNSSSTAEVAMLDNAANERMRPFLNATGSTTTNCVCSDVPSEVTGEGTDLYASFPALGAETTTVDVAIPQFPVIKGIQVTRS